MQEVIERLEIWLERAFDSSTTCQCLALRHGLRIIGAAVISPESHSDIHLIPGPCISMEYRNRGFGTRLLEQSLARLRDAGLAEASGVAKENAPVTKFLYPKFNGMAAPHDFAPLVAV
jgi:N-acetylglutamate synthase-like GNAT family acetyltransferase